MKTLSLGSLEHMHFMSSLVRVFSSFHILTIRSATFKLKFIWLSVELFGFEETWNCTESSRAAVRR